MGTLILITIAIGLAIDSFAVSISAGIALKKIHLSVMGKISLTFAFFQGMMPVVGWSIGRSFKEYIEAYDHWIAFGLLSIIGGKMVYESFDKSDDAKCALNPYCKKTITALSVATSIDALAVGVSFSILGLEIVSPALIIGLVTFIFSFGGLIIGIKLGNFHRRKIEFAGGVILVGIGIKILVDHLFYL